MAVVKEEEEKVETTNAKIVFNKQF